MLYEFDATILAARQMQGNPDYQNTLEIDENLATGYLEQLLAIYNAVNFPAGDSVTKCLPIHVFPLASVNGFLMGLNTDEEWVQSLQQGSFPTGYTPFDSLFTLLDLEVENIIELSTSIIAVFGTEKNLHLEGVINAFQGLTGVLYAEPNGFFGDGDNITAETNVGYTDFIFEHGWGDCPAGCIFAHYWQIRVNEDCSVEFINSWGTPLAFPCESIIIDDVREEILAEKIPLLPTVTTDFLTVKIEDLAIENIGYSILTIDGKMMLIDNTLHNNSSKIDVSNLPKGSYFLTLNIDNQIVIKRFVKM